MAKRIISGAGLVKRPDRYRADHVKPCRKKVGDNRAIADHADNDGRCFPGIKSLCLKMRLKERQVQDLIKRLEKKNVFNVERGNGRGHLTEFKMKKVQDSASITPTKKVQKTTPIEEEKGAGFCKKRVQDSATPIYKEEPLIESSSSWDIIITYKL